MTEGLVNWPGTSLCSRFRSFFPDYLVLTNYPTGASFYIVAVPSGMTPDTPYSYIERGRPPGNFPYGYDVFPDVPV